MDEVNPVVLFVALLLLVVVVAIGSAAIKAAAYERVTGKKISVVDVLILDKNLRVIDTKGD